MKDKSKPIKSKLIKSIEFYNNFVSGKQFSDQKLQNILFLVLKQPYTDHILGKLNCILTISSQLCIMPAWEK